jgi:hypothetical protein
MVSQLPSNMLITRVRPALYPGELFAVQVVLGIIEAPLFPGVSNYVSHLI